MKVKYTKRNLPISSKLHSFRETIETKEVQSQPESLSSSISSQQNGISDDRRNEPETLATPWGVNLRKISATHSLPK
jgi:hypothetical protein